MIDITNQRFGRLVALRPAYKLFKNGRKRRSMWLCACDCDGKQILVASIMLRNGNTRSCGCLRIELLVQRSTSHGKSNTVEYWTWARMLNRCYNKNNRKYWHYGGRGITVCEQWHTFENFLADMGNRPASKSLDRIDVNGNYCPENCRWATAKEQARHKRRWPAFLD